MATAQIPWNDGSGHDISVEWDGTQDGEIKVSSPTNPSLTAQRTRSIQVQTTAGAPQVTRTITVVQEAAVYTYEYSVIASPSDILPASGGFVTYTAQLKTYLQGNLLKTESVTPTCRVISGTGFSASGNKVAAASRGTEYSSSERSAQVAVEFEALETGETLSETVTVTQAANNRVVVYGKPTITSFEVADIPASGGSVSSGDVEYSQSRHYYYDSGQTEELSSLTTGGQVTFGDPVTAESLGTTVKDRTIVGQLTCQVAMNGQTSVEGDASVYQQANSATYGAVILIVTSPVSVEATGGTFDIVSQAGQTVSFTSGAIRAGSVSLSYSQLTPVEGFVLDGSQVTVSNNTTTEERSYTVRVTAEGEGGLSMIKSVKFNQDAGVRTYSDITITEFKYPQIPAAGGTVTPTLSYSQTWGWNGSTTGGGTITSGAQVSYSGTNVDASTGVATVASKGTTVSGVTTATTATVTVSMNGKTAEKSADVQQAANEITGEYLVDNDGAIYLYSGGTEKLFENPTNLELSSDDWTGHAYYGIGLEFTSGSKYQPASYSEAQQKYPDWVADVEANINDVFDFAGDGVVCADASAPDLITPSAVNGRLSAYRDCDITENKGSTARTGYFQWRWSHISTFMTPKVTVSQEAGSYLNVNPTSLSFEASGGTKQITIDTNESWTIE